MRKSNLVPNPRRIAPIDRTCLYCGRPLSQTSSRKLGPNLYACRWPSLNGCLTRPVTR